MGPAACNAHAEQTESDNGKRTWFGNTNGVDRVEFTVELPGDDIVVCAVLPVSPPIF